MESIKKKRGFAAMDRAVVSQIASKGGKAAHAQGTAHEFTSEEARTAGRKGGYATHRKLKELKASAAEIFDEGDAALAPEGIDGAGR